MNLQTAFQKQFSVHVPSSRTESNGRSTTILVDFSNNRYHAWISEDKDGFTVGINEQHCHYDLGSREENLHDALEHFDEILLSGQIAAVGLVDAQENYLIATLELTSTLDAYSHEKPKIEIVTFRNEH